MVARLSSLCLSFIVFLATSRGQQCDGIASDGVNCQVTFPDYDVGFPIPSDDRGICIPSVTESGARIKTLVLKFSYQPDCVEVGLSACFSDNSTVYVDTNDLFASETDPGDFDIIVNGKNTTVEYGPNGTHSILPDTRTVSPTESFQFVQWRSFFSGAPTAKRLCAVGDGDRLMDHPDFIEYEYVEKADELSCVTDEDLTGRFLVLEHKIVKKEGMIAYPETYRLAIANGGTSCNSASRESPVLTLTVEGPVPTPSPSPTPLPSSTGPPGKGGTDGSAIGIAVGVPVAIIVLIAVVVGVILLCACVYVRNKKSQKTGDSEESPAQGGIPLDEIKEPSHPPHPPNAQTHKHAERTVVVLNTISSNSELGPALANHENGQFEEFQSREEEESGMWHISRTNIILHSDRYVRFYIIYRESPEQLKKDHPLVWEIMRDIKTRGYNSNTRKKVVFVQVTSRTGSEGGAADEVKKLDDYTVGIAENKLSNSYLIYSKVKLRESHGKITNVTPLTTVEDTDDVMHVQTSPESSPGPHTRVQGEQRPENPFLSLPANPTSGPPSYTSQQAPLSLSQAGSVPLPQTAEQPMQSSESQKELISQMKKLNLTQEQIRDELMKQTKLHEKTAEHTGRTADNTGDMRENLEETRLTVNETSDMLQGRSVSEEQPALS